VIPSSSPGSIRWSPTLHTCSPAVAEVKLAAKPLTRLETAERDPVTVQRPLSKSFAGDGLGDVGAVSEPELVQVRVVPPGERVIDRRRQLTERVTARGGDDSAGPGPQPLAAAFDEFHADRQP
jgi:hypothetical protein